MNEVVVFPDVEALLVVYLAAELADRECVATVHNAIPDPRPESFVTISRVGGPRRGQVVDMASLVLESWAVRPAVALVLAQLVRGLVGALPGQVLGDDFPVYRVDEFSGPANLPDPLSNHSRYTQTVSVWIRGRPS